MDKTRTEDIKIVEQGLKSFDPNIRRQAKDAGDKIRKQAFDSRLKRRREQLVHEIRHGRSAGARELKDDLVKSWDGGRLAIGAEDYDRIFGNKNK